MLTPRGKIGPLLRERKKYYTLYVQSTYTHTVHSQSMVLKFGVGGDSEKKAKFKKTLYRSFSEKAVDKHWLITKDLLMCDFITPKCKRLYPFHFYSLVVNGSWVKVFSQNVCKCHMPLLYQEHQL